MRLINVHTLHLEEFNAKPPEYAILSHRWRDEEILFQEIAEDKDVQTRKGYAKFSASCKRAKIDGFDYIWIDTCCIDKSSSAELSEAINSMYQWYRNSSLCYAYLDDVDDPVVAADRAWASPLTCSEWFTRGWTLQELIAPRHVQFYTRDWRLIGSKVTLAHALTLVTRIPTPVLCHGLSSSRPCIAQIMSWAADRETTRVEDRAYSLMGLFGVFMPILYGEGKIAFRRLQLEIMRSSNDQSIFAWCKQRSTGSVLADSPSFFAGLSDVFILTYEERLNNNDGIEDNRWSSYTVTNNGIRIWLPVVRYRVPGHPSLEYVKASLACYRKNSKGPMTIVLTQSNGRYRRGYPIADRIIAINSLLTELNLSYEDEEDSESSLAFHCPESNFTLHTVDVSQQGFVQCCLIPEEITLVGPRLALPGGERGRQWHAVLVYVNDEMNTCFQLVVGHYSGVQWVHVLCDEEHREGVLPSSDTEAWTHYAWKIYERMWEERRQIARCSQDVWGFAATRGPDHRLIKYAHLPGTELDVVVFCDKGVFSRNLSLKVGLEVCSRSCEVGEQMYSMDRIPTFHSNMICLFPGCFSNCHEHCLPGTSKTRTYLPYQEYLSCEVFGGLEDSGVSGSSDDCLRCGHPYGSHMYGKKIWDMRREIKRDAL